MNKIALTKEHLAKRAEKKNFVLRYDVLGGFLDEQILPHEYFDLHKDFPEEVDKVLLDAMYSGDWFSVYESEVLPLHRLPRFTRFRHLGVDLFAEWEKIVHGRGKDFWLTYRISEVDVEYTPIKDEHPEWFIPAFGQKMNNMAVPEIRAHKLKVVGEVMRKYDFDGLDIDFERHTPILPPGKQWELRECVTDFMRKLRVLLLKIAEEKGKVIMLSARVPDCLKGCHMDGLDIETWVQEDLVDCLALGSRSFDIKVEEFRALSNDIQIYGEYDPHHTVDGYLFPNIEILRGVWYTHLQRGADAVEFFNWSGEGNPECVEKQRKLVYDYGMNAKRDLFYVEHAQEDFTGINDKEFLAKQNKTYVIDRKGGYPWGIGYGNLNADRQLPCKVDKEAEVQLYVAENAGVAKKATLRVLVAEVQELPTIYFNGKKVGIADAKPHRDLQVTTEEEAPISGTTISLRLANGVDLSKACTLLTLDVTGLETNVGYNALRVLSNEQTSIEKVELEIVLQ